MSTAPAMNSALQVTIEIVGGPNKGYRQTFQQNKWTVGRGPENDLVLAQDLKISRNHIEVQATLAQIFVRNISQKNIMMVNGLLAIEQIMSPNAVVQIGETLLRFQFDRPVAEKPVLKVVPNTGSAFPIAKSASRTASAAGMRSPSLQSKTAGGVGRPLPPRPVELPLFSHPKFKFYAMIAGVGLVGLWLFSQNPLSKTGEKVRGSVVVTQELGKSEGELEKLREDMKMRGVDTPQFRLAEAQFIKGFRDYQQGQYARAMEAFQSARSFYPDHELATRYWTLSKRRFDEKIQLYMIQGRRYLGTQNYRLCEAAFATVIIHLKDENNPTYQEAKQFRMECSLKAMRK